MNSKWLKLYNELLQSKLTRDDQHQIEREALDDPFLRDALEGVELYHGADQGALQDRLEQRLKSETKSKVFMLWKYAAAASIVLVAGAFLFLKPYEKLSLESNAYSQQIATPTSDDDLAIILAPEDTSVESIEDTAIHALISHGVQEVDISDSKVDRIHPKDKQLSKASDEAMVHVVSNTRESDIGLSTQAIISAADHANSQRSDNLKTARGRAIPTPAKMPIGLAESNDPMSVHENNVANAYIPNHHQTEIYRDTLPQLIMPKIDLNNAILVAEVEPGVVLYSLADSLSGRLPEISLNGRKVDQAYPNELSSSILSNNLNSQYQPIAADLRQSGNIGLVYDFDTLLELGTSPVIGWAAFDSILQSEVRRSSQMTDVQGSLLISFDAAGNVQAWDSKGLPDSSINALLQQIGPWNINDEVSTVVYPFEISTAKIDTIEPQTYDQFGNEIDGYPLIGWAAFDSLLAEEMPDKETMFLFGIKDGHLNELRIMVDPTGKVTQFESGAMPTDGVERALEKTGKWQTKNESAIIVHRHKMFYKRDR